PFHHGWCLTAPHLAQARALETPELLHDVEVTQQRVLRELGARRVRVSSERNRALQHSVGLLSFFRGRRQPVYSFLHSGVCSALAQGRQLGGRNQASNPCSVLSRPAERRSSSKAT